jgi:hypothetical protein
MLRRLLLPATGLGAALLAVCVDIVLTACTTPSPHLDAAPVVGETVGARLSREEEAHKVSRAREAWDDTNYTESSTEMMRESYQRALRR